MGAEINLLFGTNSHPKKGDPDFALANQIFCHRPPTRRLNQLVLVALRSRLGLKRTVEAVEVELNGVDLTFLEPPLPPFSRIFNAEALFDRARAASIWGSPMATVASSEKFAAYHWTGPVPLKSLSGPNIYTIHDLVPIQFPYLVVDRPGNSARLHAAIAREADAIITVSETSKAKILELLKVPPERVTVTYQPAPTPKPLPQADAEYLVGQLYNLSPQSYALYLGAVEPRKNLRRLIEAFILSKVDVPLIMAGPLGWLYDEEQDLLALIGRRYGHEVTADVLAAKIGDRLQQQSIAKNVLAELPVRHLGYLPRRHVTALLQCAKFFAFPSLYEGFGLPALEAMHFNVPVLTSRTGSLCEVVGEAALLVDPLSVEDMTRGIRELNADSDLRAELAQRGPNQAAKFSEEMYIQRLGEAYAKVGVKFPETSNRAKTF
jgi:glycosyltransferase involved in cell wall biosynthesis